MGTRSSGPRCELETYAKACVVDFTLDKDALVAHETADIIKLEDPVLETRLIDLTTRLNSDENQFEAIEQRVLDLLRTSGSQILDDEVSVNTIDSSASKWAEVRIRITELMDENEKLMIRRNAYVPLAERIAILYLALSDLRRLSPLYHFSFDSVKAIAEATMKEVVETEDRNAVLAKNITFAVFCAISRLILRQHQILLAFVFAIAILKTREDVSESDWNTFINGISKSVVPFENPVADKIV
jgi:dynein heavy chain